MAPGERVFLSLGSNVGDRELYLGRAAVAVDRLPATRLVGLSELYLTQPVGRQDQPEFLNAAAEIETGLEPEELLSALQGIEDLLGRVRQERWGPRTIDLDIIYYGKRIIKSPRLEIPHPRAHQRAFVLIPLAEIASHWLDPVRNLTVEQLLKFLDRADQEVRPYSGWGRLPHLPQEDGP